MRSIGLVAWFFVFAVASMAAGCMPKQPIDSTGLSNPVSPLTPNPAVYGRWETVIPKEGGASINRILGMQTVHAILLPTGKVLWASGSSWRNHDTAEHQLEYYPKDDKPNPGTGVFVKPEESIENQPKHPFHKSKLETYYELVNNVAIYDPDGNTFYRIPHPIPVDDPSNGNRFSPNDLFCSGHLHLPDGNILFTGGTQYYFPFRTGNNSSYIFDWKKEQSINWATVDWRRMPLPASENNPWVFSGFMPRGRW